MHSLLLLYDIRDILFLSSMTKKDVSDVIPKKIDFKTHDALVAYVEDNFRDGMSNYLLIDEIQMCDDFERAIEDYIENRAHSIFRNPLIAEILYKSQDVETYSSGIRRMYEECKENGVKLDFREEKTGFTIIFYRKNFNGIIESSEKFTEKFTESEQKILNEISKNPSITQMELSKTLNITRRAIVKIMENLKEKDILKRIGSDKKGYWKINKRI